jgi:hypothetical protein
MNQVLMVGSLGPSDILMENFSGRIKGQELEIVGWGKKNGG